MTVALIAHGPNDLQVPCMFFNTLEDAAQYLTNHGVEKSEKWGYEIPNSAYHQHQEDDEGNRLPSFWDAFFTSYYGGCGDVDSFSIKEIEIGKPTLRWDLD